MASRNLASAATLAASAAFFAASAVSLAASTALNLASEASLPASAAALASSALRNLASASRNLASAAALASSASRNLASAAAASVVLATLASSASALALARSFSAAPSVSVSVVRYCSNSKFSRLEILLVICSFSIFPLSSSICPFCLSTNPISCHILSLAGSGWGGGGWLLTVTESDSVVPASSRAATASPLSEMIPAALAPCSNSFAVPRPSKFSSFKTGLPFSSWTGLLFSSSSRTRAGRGGPSSLCASKSSSLPSSSSSLFP